ncbi:MAG: glycoside hydrolase family 2 TIM barrel-domain containing protein [Pseudomonadota bacterium]
MFRLQCIFAALLVSMSASAADVYPAADKAYSRSLNGSWSFKYLPTLSPGADGGFTAPGFDVSAWATIPVPANWELQGFAEPAYGDDLKDGLGLYRRSFRVPPGWQGRRIFLRFEGVAFGYQVYVNGKLAGESSASAFNRHTFDITDQLIDADNVLAVRVTTKPHGVEFDLNDDWSLSGIYRDVSLFSVPALHLQDVSTHTRLVDGVAQLSVDALLSQAQGEVRARLVGPDGRTVADLALPRSGPLRRAAVLRVPRPRLWSAETPSLYRLRLTVSENGRPVHTLEERIGLREVSIRGAVLQLNGRPIKLRGVNHHDLEPRTGRAVTEAQMRADLQLMKKANVNFVRTAHYPPHPRLLALCDEMGLYVMDEVSIGHGEKHLDDPDYRANILARVQPTIMRDKNRPSVLIWSIGNENPINDAELEAGRLAKQLDPTRPITYPKIGSYFAKNFERIPAFVDIYAPHYPSNATLKGYTGTLERPTILTEYAHALGLATDRIQAQWDMVQASPNFAGGSIWHFHDQGILRASARPVDVSLPSQAAWVDATHHYDTHGLDGADGLTYADRTPQVDFWQMRKVYAPVQFALREAGVKPGAHSLELTVENRHDFRSLSGIKLLWTLERNGVSVQQGRLAPEALARTSQTLRIALTIPADAEGDVLALKVRAVDEQGMQINERTIRLTQESGARAAWPALLNTLDRPIVRETQSDITITAAQWVLKVQRATGALTIHDKSGRQLVAGIYPHAGRKATMAEALRSTTSALWLSSVLTTLEEPVVSVVQRDGLVRVAVSGRYLLQDQDAARAAGLQIARMAAGQDDLIPGAANAALPGNGKGGLQGGYGLEIGVGGAISVSYDFVPVDAVGRMSEAGLSVLAPQGMGEFRWIGQGPYAGYPGKDRLNEFGLFHLNREDLHFQGNRRETELAVLSTAEGAGFAFATDRADVAVERSGLQTLLSHNALIGSLGNKGTSPEVSIDQPPRIAGAFTLVPVTNAWPAPLRRWFGPPGPAKKVFRPFHHSYDQ